MSAVWHPWLRINRVLRVMLHTRWSAEAWPQVKAQFTKALALTLVLWVVAEPVDAWDEPGGFRDVPWGSPLALVQEKLPELRCAGGDVYADCTGTLIIGDVRVFTKIEFQAGRMDYVYLSFPPADFYAIEVAFVGRYGEPTARRSDTVQNRMGATFQKDILEWQGEKIFIYLAKYGSTLTDSFAIIQTVERMRRALEDYRQKLQEGKKDL
jgi:hypothetical protein